MEELKKILIREWELFALGGALLVGAGLLLAAMAAMSVGGWTFGRGAVAVNRPMKLNGSAFAFLRSGEAETMTGRNPFASGLSVPEKPKPKVVEKPVAPPPPVVKPVVVEKEEPVVEAAPAEEPKKEEPKGPRRVVGMASYSFMNVNNSGKSVAVFSIRTSATDSENYALGVGESGGGVKVLAITDDAIMLLDAAGRRWKVQKGVPCRMFVLKEQ